MIVIDSSDDISSEELVSNYIRFFRILHDQSPRIRHMGGYWYEVSGEIVHHKTLCEEVDRLRILARKRKRFDPAMLTRLIARLKGI